MFLSNPEQVLADLQQMLSLAMQYQEGGQLAQAESLYRQALGVCPGHPLILHHLGAMLLNSGRADAALPLLEQARRAEPANGAHVLLLTECLLRLDRFKEAKKLITEAIRQGLRHTRADELLEHARAGRQKKMVQSAPAKRDILALEQLLKVGRYAEAEARARGLVQQYPQALQAWRHLGMACMALRRYEAAVEPLRRSLALGSAQAETYYNLGFALEQIGHVEQAITAYREAARLKPNLAEAHNNLGNLLIRARRPEEALAAYRRASELKPEMAELIVNVGNALRELGRHEEAVEAYRSAIRLKPDLFQAHNNLPFVLSALGEYKEALRHCMRAMEIQPSFFEPYNNLGLTLLNLDRTQEACDAFRRAMELNPDDPQVISNLMFPITYLDDTSSQERLALARRYDELLNRAVSAYTVYDTVPDPSKRLRIGLVSGDFGLHPVGYFLANVLANIDQGGFELFAYETAVRADEMNAQLRQYIPNWRVTTKKNLDDAAFAQLIHSDGIDILVDLAGYTSHNRLPVFAWHAAPVQVAWLGYFATTGLAAMDWILADRWVLPPEEEGHFVERPWRLPDSYYCFTPPDEVVEVASLPALKKGHITFGCFNKNEKVNDRVIACWARVLDAVPHSHLFLKNKALDDAEVMAEYQDRFARHGIGAERLRFEGASARASYLAAYHEVDIALDPFPFPGGTTSIEGLWMGVPVLTLRGDRFIGHQGETILHSVDMPEWIAQDVDDYVAKAKTFASDLAALAELRASLRQQLLGSPLCDAPRFARNLEQAFRGMWHIWCAQQLTG